VTADGNPEFRQQEPVYQEGNAAFGSQSYENEANPQNYEEEE